MTKLRTVSIGKAAVILAIASLVITTTTHAQAQTSSPGAQSVLPTSRPQTALTADTTTTDLRLPSAGKATGLALAFTLIPTAVGASMVTDAWDPGPGAVIAGVGLLVGPSIGYFYGGCTDRGLTGIGMRSMVAGVGTAIVLSRNDAGPVGFRGSYDLMIAAWVGAGLIAVLSIYDLIMVHSSVEKQNSERRLSRVRLTPSLSPDGQTLGMQLSMAF